MFSIRKRDPPPGNADINFPIQGTTLKHTLCHFVNYFFVLCQIIETNLKVSHALLLQVVFHTTSITQDYFKQHYVTSLDIMFTEKILFFANYLMDSASSPIKVTPLSNFGKPKFERGVTRSGFFAATSARIKLVSALPLNHKLFT